MAIDGTIASLAIAALRIAEPAASADDLAARAEAAFGARDYDAVTDALEAAHALDPRPSFVYGLAQADRLGGRCAAAIDRYAEYLELHPPEGPAEEARLAIEECRAVLDARDRALVLARDGDVEAARDVLVRLQHERALTDVPELALARGDVEREVGYCDEARASYRALEQLHPKAEVIELARAHARDCPPGATVPPPRVLEREPETVVLTRRPRPWHRDPAAIVLASVGTAGVAVGLGLVAGSVRLHHGANDLAVERDFADRVAVARRVHTAGWITLAVGCSLLVGSAIRWGVLARRARR